jgi:APA family basic amino acid/polyamine antiporter
MALGILISIFGCNNGLILTGARAYYAMARDGLFFRAAESAQPAPCPCLGAGHPVRLVLRSDPAANGRRRRLDGTVTYGNLYGNLLNYVISAALIFYVLSIAGIFVLRRKRPDSSASISRLWLSGDTGALYCWERGSLVVVLFIYQTATTWPGLVIVLTGVPVYFIWQAQARRQGIEPEEAFTDECTGLKHEKLRARPVSSRSIGQS